MNDGLDDLVTFDELIETLAPDATMEEYFHLLCLMAQDAEALSVPDNFDHANPAAVMARIEQVRSRVQIMDRFLRLCTERLAN